MEGIQERAQHTVYRPRETPQLEKFCTDPGYQPIICNVEPKEERRGPQGQGGKTEGGISEGETKSRETLDSGKHTEGFGVGGVGGWGSRATGTEEGMCDVPGQLHRTNGSGRSMINRSHTTLWLSMILINK